MKRGRFDNFRGQDGNQQTDRHFVAAGPVEAGMVPLVPPRRGAVVPGVAGDRKSRAAQVEYRAGGQFVACENAELLVSR